MVVVRVHFCGSKVILGLPPHVLVWLKGRIFWGLSSKKNAESATLWTGSLIGFTLHQKTILRVPVSQSILIHG